MNQEAHTSRPWTRMYPVGSETLHPLPFQNLMQVIEQASHEHSRKKAFSCCLPNGMDGSITFAETQALSDAFAVWLREECNLKPGDRVAVQMPNCLAYPIAIFGILKAGCVAVNTNPLYTPTEMEHQFRDSGARVLVIIDLFADRLLEVIPKTQIKTIVRVSVSDLFPFLKGTLVKTVQHIKKMIPPCPVQTVPFTSVLERGKFLMRSHAGAPKSYWKDISSDTLALLQYTGGTTGVSKGAMITHGNLLANLAQILTVAKSKLTIGEESVLTVLPLYHIFAFTLNLFAFYFIGGHNILVPSPRPITNLKAAFEKYPITWLPGVNTLFAALLNETWFTGNKPKALKASIAGGTALHKAVAERWVATMGSSVYEGYGLTETSPVVSFNPLDGRIKNETVGIPVVGTDVALLDENMKEVALGEAGEIAVKGPQVMKGYWNRPEETDKVIRDGWLLTGDIGVMDDEGYIRIVDRKKDMILVSGFNVYPNEVEDTISRLEGVAEVCVIGTPDPDTGERVCAYVVKRDPGLTPEMIREHCKRFMTNYKIPRTVEFRSELPKTPIGKILRRELRRQVMESKNPA